MPNIVSVLKDEIRRLARREVRINTRLLRKQSAQYRSDIAALKRQVGLQQQEIAFLRRQEKRRIAKGADAPTTPADGHRYSPKWLKAHRKKLDISAADYGKLVGASGLSVYKWEGGTTLPRAAQRAKLAAVRGLGKREVLKRLEML